MEFFWPRKRRDLDEEIEGHLRMAAQDRVARGEHPAHAAQSARRELGNAALIHETTRDQWGWRWLETLLQDLRYAVRMLRKSPGFTAVAIITLALGIGANTAIFSVVDAVLLRPLPFPHSDRLVSVQYFDTVQNVPHPDVSYPDFFDWRKQNQVFSSMAAFHDNDYTLTGTDESAHLSGEVVTSDFFKTLAVAPLLGPGFVPEDENPGHQVVALSNRLWRMTFGADPKIIGRSIELNHRSYTVVGVMPPDFAFPITSPPIELWTASSDDAEGSDPVTAARGARFPDVIARLKSGETLAQAQGDIVRLNSNLAKQYPNTNLPLAGAYLEPELQHLVGDVAPALLVLLGAVGCVLLMACVNVAGLLLGRGMLRQREMAVRAALGASRSRIVRQLLTESVLLAVFGGAAGLALGFWGIVGLIHVFPEGVPRVSEAHMNSSVFLFALAASVVTGILFGLAPAVRASRTSLAESIKEGGPMHSPGKQRGRLRAALVVAETALALVLLTGAGLMIQSFARLESVNPGFNPHRLLTFNFDLSATGYSTSQTSAFYDQFLHRIDAFPGVVSSAGSFPLPMSGNRVRPQFSIQDHPVAPGNEPHANMWLVTSDFFNVMGIPLVEWREFSQTDGPTAENVAVVNQAFARRYFPNENPIGKYIVPNELGRKNGSGPPTRQIVGVVGDVRTDLSKAAQPQFYLPYSQVPTEASLVVVVRTVTDPGNIAGSARATLKSLDRNVPMYDVESMDDYVGAWATPQQIVALLVSAFAGLALTLTAFGLYGVISYTVTQRTHEIGVRMALGAQPRDVLRLILGQGAKLALFGLGVGVVAAFLLTRLMSSLLYGVSATDPLTFVGVALLLTLVALAAAYIPARRAMRVDPMVALRYE